MAPKNNQKRLGRFIIIQITSVVMDKNKIKKHINNILLSNKETTNLKKKKDKIETCVETENQKFH